MKILYLASSPDDGSFLDVRREIAHLQYKISKFSNSMIDLLINPAVNSTDFGEVIKKSQADIIHIACHSENSRLRFDNGKGRRADIDSKQILHILNGLSKRPNLIIFSACDSHLIARDLSEYGCPILSFDDSVSDADSILAISAFYENIFTGESIRDSFISAKYIFESSRESNSAFIITVPENFNMSNIIYTPPIISCKPKGRGSKRPISEFVEQSEIEISICIENLPRAAHHVLVYTVDREQAMEDMYNPKKSKCSLEEWRAMMTSLVLYPSLGQKNITADTNWICSPKDNLNCIISSQDKILYTISEKVSKIILRKS